MIPANYSDATASAALAIYQGARWAHTFTFTDTTTGDPIVLTSYLPFVMEIKHATKGTPLATVTVDSTNASTGIILVSLTAAQTDLLALGNVRIGMRDASNNPWGEGIIPVLPFTPEPA